MKNTLFRKCELAIFLLRMLNQVLGVCSRFLGSKISGSDPSLLPRFGPVDEGQLRPVLIPLVAAESSALLLRRVLRVCAGPMSEVFFGGGEPVTAVARRRQTLDSQMR